MEATTAAVDPIARPHQQEADRLKIPKVTTLVKKAKDGDRAAFEELMRAYSGFIYSLAFRMLGRRADAEDVFQETFFRAWSHLASFRSGGNFTYWIKRIGTNLCLDRLNARKRQAAFVATNLLDEVESLRVEEQYSEQTRHSQMVDCLLAELSATHRAAVVLFYLEERSVEETARALRQRPGTVKVWLFRAREKMKATLEEKGYEL